MSDIYQKNGVKNQEKSAQKKMTRNWSQKYYTIQDKDHIELQNYKIACGYKILLSYNIKDHT